MNPWDDFIPWYWISFCDPNAELWARPIVRRPVLTPLERQRMINLIQRVDGTAISIPIERCRPRRDALHTTILLIGLVLIALHFA